MSTSILYHTNGINGVQYKATHYRESSVVFAAEMRAGALCKKCGNLHTRCKGKKILVFERQAIYNLFKWRFS